MCNPLLFIFLQFFSRSPPSAEQLAKACLSGNSFDYPDRDDTSDEDSGEESDQIHSKGMDVSHEMVWREEKGKSVFVPKFYPPRNSGRNYSKSLTMKDVSKHNTKDDCWVVIESHVYDISKFVSDHPGGWLNLENMAGKDCTDAFANYHPASVYRTLLPTFYIGDVVDSLDNHPFVIEHRRIRQELLRRGLFETNIYFYYLKFLWLVSLFWVAVCLTVQGTTIFTRMSGAIVMVSIRLVFILSSFKNSLLNSKLVGNILASTCFYWSRYRS
jgi:cytochrome b involved in lipid metabolism